MDWEAVYKTLSILIIPVLGFLIHLEHRLTRIETKLDYLNGVKKKK